MKKILLYGSGVAGTVAGLVLTSLAHADVLFEVPTSTASSLTANVGSQLGDAGTLAVIAVIAGIYLVFYVIKQLISLVPKAHGRRN